MINVKTAAKWVGTVLILAAWCWFWYLFGSVANESKITDKYLPELPKQFLLKESEVITKGSGWEELVAYTAADTIMRDNLSRHLQEVRYDLATGIRLVQRLVSYEGEVVDYNGEVAIVHAKYILEEGVGDEILQTTAEAEFHLIKEGRNWFVADIMEPTMEEEAKGGE